MRRWAWVAVLLAAIVVAAVAVAWVVTQRSGAHLLRESYDAERKYSYLGVLEIELLRRANPIHASLTVMHAAPDKTRTDVVSPKEFEGYVVINNGDTRYIYSPSSKRWYGNTLRPPEQDVELALENYRVRAAGRDKVIDRPCRRLKITPRYAGNPRKILWVDDETNLVLRKELRNAEGEVISRSRYTEIHIKKADAPEDEAFLPPDQAEIKWGTKSPPRKFTALKPTYVPRGYRFDEDVRVRIHRGAERAHLRYTDGLNTISVFQEIASDKSASKPKGDASKTIATASTLYWNAVERQVGGLRVVIMGDIAADELRKMAESIQPAR